MRYGEIRKNATITNPSSYSFQLGAIWNEMLWSSSNFRCLVAPITVKSGLKYEKEKS